MAKIKFTDIPPIGNIFDGALDLKVDGGRERAVYTDMDTGAKIILYGENLKETAGEEGHFSAGTVEKLVFKNAEGELIITVTEGNFKAKDFNDDYDANGAWGVFDALFGGDDRIEGGASNEPLRGMDGDDRIIGGKGDDTIYGGAGDDVLTGGKETDHFYFGDEDHGVEHDRITDLDLSGANMDDLNLGLDVAKVTKTNGGKDAVVHLENGSTLELDGVTKSEFLDFWNTVS